MHYLTRRSDSAFWRDFRKRMAIMPKLEEKLALWWQLPLLDHDTVQLDMFKAPSWLMVGAGIGIFDRDSFRRLTDNFSYGRHIAQAHQSLLQKQAHYARACMLYTDLLDLLQRS